MSRPGGDFDDVAWLDDDPEPTPGPTAAPRLPWPRWFTLVVAVLAIAAVVAVVNTVRRNPPAVPAAVATTPASSSRPASPTRSVPRTSPTQWPISVSRLGHPLLGITAGWELFARGNGVLVRIQPAAGRVTLTTGADLRSGAPASLLIGSDRVVLRSQDNVPGYVVPDDQPAVELPLLGNQGGPVFPGPAPGQMWVPPPADDQKQVMTLATLDGRAITGSTSRLELPQGSFARDAVADGAGYLLFTGIGGVYDARPDGVRRISTGALLAVGPTGWLVAECDTGYRCQEVLIDRVDGHRQVVSGGIVNPYSRGVIAPDGSTAAILTNGPNNTLGLAVIDFARNRRLLVRNLFLNLETFDGGVVYSPDSKWLFAATESGTIAAINPRTATAIPLDDDLPTVIQLAVRPAPGR